MTVTMETMEYRIWFSNKNERDAEYFKTETEAREKFESYKAQGLKCTLEKMDTVLGVADYTIDKNM